MLLNRCVGVKFFCKVMREQRKRCGRREWERGNWRWRLEWIQFSAVNVNVDLWEVDERGNERGVKGVASQLALVWLKSRKTLQVSHPLIKTQAESYHRRRSDSLESGLIHYGTAKTTKLQLVGTFLKPSVGRMGVKERMWVPLTRLSGIFHGLMVRFINISKGRTSHQHPPSAILCCNGAMADVVVAVQKLDATSRCNNTMMQQHDDAAT